MNDEQLLRYSRHIMLPQMDIDGQEKLLAAHVLVVGLGGLGSPVVQYLAASGVGKLTLVDDDLVELSNLQRQPLHSSADVGKSKVQSALESVAALNPEVHVNALQVRADDEWFREQLSAENINLVIDCTDNAAVRYALNRVCLQAGVPWISAAAVGVSGQITLFNPADSDSPCYACLYPQLSDDQLSCAESGVLSPLVGVMGSMQALEALKWLAGSGRSLNQTLLTFDALASDWRRWAIKKRPQCPACGSVSGSATQAGND
ncbi:MAG: molybdopterin-synthase adenylyltransferase MoeB [Oceanospirillaceae bacterium]|uniref:HesA/MoeB/ThiF family protein n=2 Tax=unclassified Thalassolituus TaxID=2624967 RepID=UPI000C4AC364|nr:molybdopterin-synthase adenylyltransferase MoeB [Thalassolituus sp. UBA1505]MAS26436.1 molybdopterin-synthase adenylyltransferase MoeB [Oceanospirillaceae bacterium]MAX98255.1 molybdopterin-synthase adenylyltransferase MoeB [Oceanospirillaceae bacterium]MBL34327.1 molybdopterin-synthase adenylyltransferase MoeB [Oceanospirillaceae bacterium]MBS54170.1 molybdopterin-synthase adenylyltransferase MoeB [Oceanospirillaceae bacterium]|tara:strand:+ start:514 stop:1296 length:783 start_codon:yes stop_codon:yes gene_type:complete